MKPSTNEVAERLKSLGYEVKQTGGNCTAWVKVLGAFEVYVTDAFGHDANVGDRAFLSVIHDSGNVLLEIEAETIDLGWAINRAESKARAP